MAEIKIEKKKPVWPWVLLGLVILALLVYFMASRDRTEEPQAPATTTQQAPATTSLFDVKENNSTVAEFVRFVEVDSKAMALDHVYTSQALTKLAEATTAMAKEINYDVEADMAQVKEYADAITKEELKTTHADSIRKATDISTSALQNMQQAKYPELANEASELRNASEAIKPEVLTLDQKDSVKGYFDKAADLLKKMN